MTNVWEQKSIHFIIISSKGYGKRSSHLIISRSGCFKTIFFEARISWSNLVAHLRWNLFRVVHSRAWKMHRGLITWKVPESIKYGPYIPGHACNLHSLFAKKTVTLIMRHWRIWKFMFFNQIQTYLSVF